MEEKKEIACAACFGVFQGIIGVDVCCSTECLDMYRKQQINRLNLVEKKPLLNVTNYRQNATEFHKQVPFYYDDKGYFWVWDWKKIKWEMIDDVGLMNMIDKSLNLTGETISATIKSNYLEAFKRVGRNNKPKEAPKKWIQFKGKAFSISSKEVHLVTPDYFFTNPIPWELGDSEETPVMDKLFEEWVGKEHVQTLYEILAYCCYTDYPIHLIFCFVGCGRNGKSQFLKILQKFIGKDNVCSSDLDVLLSSRFESFRLYKKLACLMGETNFGIMSKTNVLKRLTGQDLIGFEMKNKSPFDDYNYSKILINSNSMPSTEDTSDGFYRRWLILDFPNEFKCEKEIYLTVPDQEYNNLARKVTKILPKLLETFNFTGLGSIEDRKIKYTMVSNPLPLFIDNFCEKGIDYYISYNDLFKAYRTYLTANKKRPVSRKEFREALLNEGLGDHKTTKTYNGEYITDYWIEGIRLKDYSNYSNYSKFSNSLYPLRKPSEKYSINGIIGIIPKPNTQEILTQIQHIVDRVPKHNLDEVLKHFPLEILDTLASNGEIYYPEPDTVKLL